MTKQPKSKQPPVHCAFDEMVKTSDLKPNPRNPNTHPDEQIRLLAKIIGETGWRAPITVSNRSGLIVRGHGRLLAALKLGLESCPVDYQDYESDAMEWADLLADNRLAELAVIDPMMLKDNLEDLDTGEIDMELAGFTDEELKRLMSQFHLPDVEPQKEPVLQSECLIEIYCDKFALEDFRKTLNKWGERAGVTINISG